MSNLDQGDSQEWQSIFDVSHQLGVASDLVWNLAVTRLTDAKESLDERRFMTRLLRVGTWSNERLLSEIQKAEDNVFEASPEMRPDEEIIGAIENRLGRLRTYSLGKALKQRANEVLYGLRTQAYAIHLSTDRLIVEATYFVVDHREQCWVHYFPNEDKPRARHKMNPQAPPILDFYCP